VNVVTIIRVQPKTMGVPSKHNSALCELQFSTVFSAVKASSTLSNSFGLCCVLASALTPQYQW
jgi:hypothetical protein